MRAKTAADILWLAQLVLYYSNGMNLLKGRGTNISAVHTYAGVAALRYAVRRVAAREIVTQCISTMAFTHTLLR